VKLHDFATDDGPRTPWKTSCPRGWRRLAEGTAFLGSQCFAPHHRHVQMALKHSRLGSVNERHLRHVKGRMAPSIKVCIFLYAHILEPALSTHFVTVPRIGQRRFLMLTAWIYDNGEWNHGVDARGHLHVPLVRPLQRPSATPVRRR